jgi:hypothetical protein
VNGTHLQRHCTAGLLGACLLAAISTAHGETDTTKPAAPETKDKPVRSLPVYQPPRRGSPAVRVGGATRGSDDPLPALHVLAPDHIALTVQPQPVFQWYLSKPAQVRFEFALISEASIEPVLERDFGTVHSRGIQQLDLADTDITLEPGVPYQWSVALIPDAQARSGDVVASGMIERVMMPPDLEAKLSNSSSDYEQAMAFAAAGIWYDALAMLSKLIRENPADATLRTQRAALLTQVGLPAVGLPDEQGR